MVWDKRDGYHAFLASPITLTVDSSADPQLFGEASGSWNRGYGDETVVLEGYFVENDDPSSEDHKACLTFTGGATDDQLSLYSTTFEVTIFSLPGSTSEAVSGECEHIGECRKDAPLPYDCSVTVSRDL